MSLFRYLNSCNRIYKLPLISKLYEVRLNKGSNPREAVATISIFFI